MIGNDVVDFNQALLESNWHRKGYLEKLFSIDEQDLIASATNPDRVLWLLWTMKEASYKIHFRQCRIRSFQPKNILCSPVFIDENNAQGHVYHDGQHYFSRSILTENFVHTLCSLQSIGFNEIKVMIGSGFDGNSERFLQENHLEDYRVVKDHHHVPSLFNQITGERLCLSISHHGRFISLVYRPKTKY